MPALTVLIGLMLLLVGLGGFGFSYAKEGVAHYTALIPAVLGVLILFFGMMSIFKDSLRKHMMHGALLVALLGVLGTVMGPVKAVLMATGGAVASSPTAIASQTITFILCLVFIIFGVRSFIVARRNRTEAV
jgi:uncharacterized protein YacL